MLWARPDRWRLLLENKLTCWLAAGGGAAGDGRPALFKMCSGVPEVENRTLAERKIAISYGLKRCIVPPHSLTPWLPITWQCPLRRSFVVCRTDVNKHTKRLGAGRIDLFSAQVLLSLYPATPY